MAHDLLTTTLEADTGGNVAASINSAEKAVCPGADVTDAFCDTFNVTIKPEVRRKKTEGQ